MQALPFAKRIGVNERLDLICECGRAPLFGAHSTFHKTKVKQKISDVERQPNNWQGADKHKLSQVRHLDI